MRFRSLGRSMLVLGLLVTTMMALRAADEKPKGKENQEVPPAPGTIKFATAPAAVQKTFKEETKNAKIELLGKGKVDEKDSDDKAIYRAIVGIGENNYDLIVSATGQVLTKSLQPITTEVKLEDCPAPVQKSLQAEAKGAKVETINKVSAGKRSDFIMDVVIQKLAYQITFAEDGTLMSKVFDDGAGDDDSDSATPKGTEKKEPEKSTKKPK